MSLVWGSWLDLQASGTLGATSQSDWPCVAAIAAGGLILASPLVWMLRRDAPMTPGVTAVLAAMAALSLANVQACVTRPHAFAVTVLLWHGSTVIALAALCALMGHRWFRWPELAISSGKSKEGQVIS